MDVKTRKINAARNTRIVNEWHKLYIKSGGDKYPNNMVMPDDSEVRDFMKSIRDYFAATDLLNIHNDAVRLRRLVPNLKGNIKEYALVRIQIDDFMNRIIRNDSFKFDSRITDWLRFSKCSVLFYFACTPISMTEPLACKLEQLYPNMTFRQCIEDYNCGDDLKLNDYDQEEVKDFIIIFCYAKMGCRDWRSLSAQSREFIRQRISNWEADAEQSGRLPF